eukprot:FR739084.1.p1 GENE.FR739084.1~~FR739084.1.p1  ORF type:complete len:201 (+),score=9.58 FR739084.1:92-604(+)
MLSVLCTLRDKDPLHRRPWLPGALLAVGIGLITMYLAFQEIYAVFLLTYGSTVVVIVVWLGILANRPCATRGADRARCSVVRPLFVLGILSYVVCGFGAWCLDMVWCEAASRLLGPMFLHPIWHAGAMIGTFLAIQAIIAAKAIAIMRKPAICWSARVVPFVQIGEELRS